MIARAFNVTIATASMPSAVSKAMHMDEEKNSKFEVLFCRSESFLFYVNEKKNDDYKIRINLHSQIILLLNN